MSPSYFVESGKIDGVKKLGRAKKYVNSDGNFTDARFEMKEKGITKLDDKQSWQWDRNSLVGTREFNGLKIIMMLVSNFDNKDVRDLGRGSNRAIFQYPVGDTVESRYVVTDWGGSMGKWGGVKAINATSDKTKAGRVTDESNSQTRRRDRTTALRYQEREKEYRNRNFPPRPR